ncbi:hypothetical protein RIF29_05741 [Crotalaria pallida]|uniref:SPARK domain-containing protein n=1 Tax=Crotalaria pallida TaxID=3830 RepID=A0AAN9J3V1_CROPI
MQTFTSILLSVILLASTSPVSSSNTVPSFPVQPDTQICNLDLSDELFGGVNDACGGDKALDRSRCCPVLAAWLFAAHARTALQLPTSASSPSGTSELPMVPDDESQKCVNSLQDSLRNRSIMIPQPNANCDAILCFCGIRLHMISSLSCPAAFNVNVSAFRNVTGPHNAMPTGAVLDLEKSCRNSSYAGCSQCLAALQKVRGNKNGSEGGRSRKILNRDCQVMSLTWLLLRNKTAYIPTVSAVLRAIMYSAHPHESKCSPDQENMPLAVADSLHFDNKNHAPLSSPPLTLLFLIITIIIVVISASS